MATLKINWPDDTIEQDKADYLLFRPNKSFNEDDETQLTDIKWIKRDIKETIFHRIMRGRKMRQKAEAPALIEPNITIE